jgi:hypothetical protein
VRENYSAPLARNVFFLLTFLTALTGSLFYQFQFRAVRIAARRAANAAAAASAGVK